MNTVITSLKDTIRFNESLIDKERAQIRLLDRYINDKHIDVREAERSITDEERALKVLGEADNTYLLIKDSIQTDKRFIDGARGRIRCAKDEIDDKKIKISELYGYIADGERATKKLETSIARDIKYDITKFPFPQYAGLVPEGISYDDVCNAIMNGKPTHPGNTVSYGVFGDDPSTIKFITQSINDPNVVNVSIAKSDDDDTLFCIDVLRGIEGIVTGFHISVKRSAETDAASVARDADIRIKLATALHHTMTHYMKSVIARQYPDSDFPQVSFDDLAAADKHAPLRDADTILDIIRGEQ